jgi:hypothetical protein
MNRYYMDLKFICLQNEYHKYKPYVSVHGIIINSNSV